MPLGSPTREHQKWQTHGEPSIFLMVEGLLCMGALELKQQEDRR